MKKTISAQIYIDLINAEIKSMEGYQEGMKVYLVPENSNPPTGYNWDIEWSSRGIQPLVSKAKHKIKANHVVDVELQGPF